MKSCQLTKLLAILLMTGLVVLLIGWLGFAVFSPRTLALFLLLPLLAMPGLIAGRVYTYQWSLFSTLLYFTHGVMEAWTLPAERYWALGEVALSVTLFVVMLLHVKCRKMHAAPQHRD